MKNIKIRKDIKERLDNFKSDESLSVNQKLELLVTDARTYDDKSIDDLANQHININMSDEIWAKLKNCKKYCKEPFSETISRLLDEYSD